MADDELIAKLKRGVETQHGVVATFARVEPVEMAHDGSTYWRGNVYVFDVDGHARATQAFAWTHADREGRERAIAVLGVPPITSAEKAAEVALVAIYRGKTSS